MSPLIADADNDTYLYESALDLVRCCEVVLFPPKKGISYHHIIMSGPLVLLCCCVDLPCPKVSSSADTSGFLINIFGRHIETYSYRMPIQHFHLS